MVLILYQQAKKSGSMSTKTKQKKVSVKLIMILLGGFTLLVRFFFSSNPSITEAAYSRGIFRLIRFGFDYTIALLPIPLLYILLALLLLVDVIWLIRRNKARKQYPPQKAPFRTRLLKGLFSVAAVVGAVIFLFYFLWAFNYERLPIEELIQIKPVPLTADDIRREADLAFHKLVQSRQEIPGVADLGNNDLDERFLPSDWETSTRDSLEKVLKSMDYPAPGRVRVKKLWTAGVMMSLGGSGLYFPFTGEAYIPEDLTPVEIPFLAAHEMAHGYGIAQEGTANFLAYLACISSSDPFIAYSGNLVYFTHIMRDLKRVSEKEYGEYHKQLPPGITADMWKQYKNWEKYRGWLMDLSAKAYDGYLKTQGVSEGIKSYDRLVVLAAAWRKAGKN